MKKKYTEFTLNLTDILEQKHIKENWSELGEQTQDFLLETYNPFLAKFEKIYQAKLSQKIEETELEELGKEIQEHLERIDKLKIDETSSSNSNISSHLNYVLYSILNKKTCKEIVDGYLDQGKKIEGLAERFDAQFEKDFILRTNIKVVNQSGKVVTKDLNSDIVNSLKNKGIFIDTDSIRKELKERFNLTDQQLKFLVSRYNQRSIQSACVAFRGLIEKKEKREDVFYINDSKSKPELETIKFSATMKNVILKDNGSSEIIDSNITSYIVDLTGLKENDNPNEPFIALPTQIAPEVLIYQSLNSSENFETPPALEESLIKDNNDIVPRLEKLDSNEEKEIIHVDHEHKSIWSKINRLFKNIYNYCKSFLSSFSKSSSFENFSLIYKDATLAEIKERSNLNGKVCKHFLTILEETVIENANRIEEIETKGKIMKEIETLVNLRTNSIKSASNKAKKTFIERFNLFKTKRNSLER